MILNIYCLRDRASVQFGNPMFLVSHGQAIRSFSNEINRVANDNMLNLHPGDFDLFHCGTFDSDDASFKTFSPVQIAVGKDLVVKS